MNSLPIVVSGPIDERAVLQMLQLATAVARAGRGFGHDDDGSRVGSESTYSKAGNV